MRESDQTSEDDPGEGVPSRRLDDRGCQAAERQEAHSAKGSRMEVGGVPFADVRRRRDRRAGLHRKERLLEAGGDQPGDLAVATHCSPVADNEGSNSNGTGDSTNASGSADGKSYSLEQHRASTSDRWHSALQRSYGGLLGCRGSVFAAAECVDQKIDVTLLRAAACRRLSTLLGRTWRLTDGWISRLPPTR